MPNPRTAKSADELKPELKQALVEIGAIIPTTEEEVALVGSKFNATSSTAEVNSAFDVVLRMINNESSPVIFMKAAAVETTGGGELAMAARNGKVIDPETLAKIEADVTRAILKPAKL